MDNIFATIREERKDFLDNEIEVVEGYTFSQYETIKKIHLYFNSHYVDGDYEEVNGVTRKKVFDNISAWRCEVATKMIDMDMKDLTLVGEDPEKDMNLFILEKELKLWLKKHDLGKKLNQVGDELPIYGTVVIEKVKDGVELVDLRYLYNDQGADSLETARYINIKHFMSVGELRKMKGKWDDVDTAIDRFASDKPVAGYDRSTGTKVMNQIGGSPVVEIYKRYGEVPLSWFTDKKKDKDEYTLARFIVAGIDSYSENDNGVILEEEGVILYKEQIEELPLKEVHYTRTKGRWLGKGVVEKLFEEQRRTNEIKNQKARAMEIGALTVLQSLDQTVQENVMTDVENGQIITVKSLISQVPLEARDMASMDNEVTYLDSRADRHTFSYDAVRGESAPASATLGSVQIQEQQATSAFDYKRENIGLFWGEYIKDIVFPQIEKDLNKEHTLRFVGSMGDMKKLRERYAKNLARKRQIDTLIKGQVPQDEQIVVNEIMKSLSQNGEKEWIEVQEDYFKDLDWQVDIITTGENRNVFAKTQNAQTLLAILQKDPALMQDPVKRKVLYWALTNMGMHLSELEDLEATASMQEAQVAPQQAIPSPMGQLSANASPQPTT